MPETTFDQMISELLVWILYKLLSVALETNLSYFFNIQEDKQKY